MTDRGESFNVARRLRERAFERPEAIAIAEPRCRGIASRRDYRLVTFRELDELSGRWRADSWPWE